MANLNQGDSGTCSTHAVFNVIREHVKVKHRTSLGDGNIDVLLEQCDRDGEISAEVLIGRINTNDIWLWSQDRSKRVLVKISSRTLLDREGFNEFCELAHRRPERCSPGVVITSLKGGRHAVAAIGVSKVHRDGRLRNVIDCENSWGGSNPVIQVSWDGKNEFHRAVVMDVTVTDMMNVRGGRRDQYAVPEMANRFKTGVFTNVADHPPKYTVGQQVEVLRSNGSWSLAIIKEMNRRGDQLSVELLDGSGSSKQVPADAQHVPNVNTPFL